MMLQTNYTAFGHSSLYRLSESFRLDYDILDLYHAKAKEHLKGLQLLDIHHVFSSFSTHCVDLLDNLRQYTGYYTSQVIPYESKLNEKVKSGHNCETCSGSCDMGHNLLLMELSQGHKEIQKKFYELQIVALPLYSNLEYPEVYRQLRYDLYILQNKFQEIAYAQESILIPTFIELQRKINARVV